MTCIMLPRMATPVTLHAVGQAAHELAQKVWPSLAKPLKNMEKSVCPPLLTFVPQMPPSHSLLTHRAPLRKPGADR